MKARRPWFKFWASEWLSNRRVALMTPAQKGVYIDLLALCWQEGAIPSDPAELAFLLRLPRNELDPLWACVKKHFRPSNRRKFLTNNRLELERGAALDKSTKAKKAADSRWSGDANALQTHCDRIESAMPHKKKKKEEEEEEKKPDANAFDFEAIYRAFPGRKGKAKGIDALGKYVKSREQFDLILAAAKRYADEERAFKASGSKAFRPEVPYFSTWVNERRWEDESETELPGLTNGATRSPAMERERAREAAERAAAEGQS